MLTACSGGGGASGGGRPSSAGNSAGGSPADFARCMREHGVTMPDPDPNSGDVNVSPPSGVPEAQWNAAEGACRQYLPGGGVPQTPDATELAGLRAYAACMREHGVEMTDPDPNTGRSEYGGRLADADKGEIQNDPVWQAAQAACEDVLADRESK